MKILFVIGKDKTYAIKAIVFIKPIKRGVIVNKRYEKNYDVKHIKHLNNTTAKCIFTMTRYNKFMSIDNIESVSNGLLLDINEGIAIEFTKAESYDQGLLTRLIEIYFDANNDTEHSEAYQMNLI